MRGRTRLGALAASAAAVAAVAVPAAAVSARSHQEHRRSADHGVSHVLLISVDGLHQSDLQWYVANHPGSEMAKLARRGAQYTNAHTQIPSDSYPGIIALTTGGNPRSTGIYYDASYNHELLPPGTTTCPANAKLGTAVFYEEALDKNPLRIDAGQGLSGLPGSILKMTGQPQTLLNPAAMPVDPKTCQPVYPHQYLKVNSMFEVARAHGLRTAWSDKHPANEILNGPSGKGVQDLFAPEINSEAIGYTPGFDWTKDNAATMQYDSYKVQAILNEIDGYDHGREHKVGTPAIFGMNFQTVSTAQKLPTSDGLTGGYLPGTTTPGPLLSRALDYINAKLQAMANELKAQGIAGSTAIIVSAKHGQSPIDPNQLTRIDDGPIISGINAGWSALHPTEPALVAMSTDDDAIMLWLSNRSQEAADFVKHYLLSHSATGNTINGAARTLAASGLEKVYAGTAAARYFGVPVSDPRHPEIWGIVQQGVVYTGGTGKIAEHGGARADDRHVALVVYAPDAVRAGTVGRSVETTQIAPTILRLLGLDPGALKAVQIEGTKVLPGS